MLEHLRKCTGTSQESEHHQELLYQLRIEDRYGGAYWLDVELPGHMPLAALDKFLRHIWLNCCSGHISSFEIDDVHYVTPFDDRLAVRSSERDMNVPVREALAAKGEFLYDYDFDFPTHLKGQLFGIREGAAGQETVRLLSRNDPIERECADCGRAATHICSYYHQQPFLCEMHAETHECGKYAMLPIVNSPRLGACSYEGRQIKLNRLNVGTVER